MILKKCNILVNEINEWMLANKLSINIEKTCYQLFEPRVNQNCCKFVIKINNITLERTNCSKYLGIFIDEKLKWTEHVKFVYACIIKYVSIFYKICYKLPALCLKNLYFSTVYPKIFYGIEIYANTCKSYLNDVMTLNNKILRILQFKTLSTNTNTLYCNFKTLPLNVLYLYQVLMFTLKFVYFRSDLPSVFGNYLNLNASLHNYATRSRNDFHLKLYSTSFGYRCFSFQCCKLWNNILFYLFFHVTD